MWTSIKISAGNYLEISETEWTYCGISGNLYAARSEPGALVTLHQFTCDLILSCDRFHSSMWNLTSNIDSITHHACIFCILPQNLLWHCRNLEELTEQVVAVSGSLMHLERNNQWGLVACILVFQPPVLQVEKSGQYYVHFSGDAAGIEPCCS